MQKYSDAMEALETLLLRMKPLEEILRKALATGYETCPQTLKERLEAFASQVQLVAGDAMALRSKPWGVRFFNSADYIEKVEAWVKKLSWHIQSFILEGTIAMELMVYEMAAEVRQGFEEMGTRFDQVEIGIAEVRSDIKQLNTDNAIPGLRYAPRARFDFGQSGRSECAPDTRKEVLGTIYSWLRPEDRDLKRLHELLPSLELLPDRSILWIYALAGAGKTTLAETVAKWCHEHDRLASSFFCARDGDRSDVQCIVQNIASDLAHYCPEFRDALLVAVKDNPHIGTASVSQQVNTLLAEPVQAANAKGASWKRRVIVIDALDECKDESAESTFLHALSLYIKELAPLVFIITSRPVPNITRGFQFLEQLGKRTQELPLDSIPPNFNERDIGIFLRRRFTEIGRRFASAGSNWVTEEQVERVSQLAEGLFIYAATVASFIEDPKVVDPRHQLNVLIHSVYGPSQEGTDGTPEARLDMLDGLYLQVLHAFFRNPSTALQARLKRVLGTIVIAEERLHPPDLSALLGEDLGSVLDVIERLRSVLSFSFKGDTHTEIRIIHLSFAEFLVDPRRCKSPHFLVKSSIQHSFLVLRCLKLMQESLKYNVCEVPSEHDHLLNHEIPGLSMKIAQHIPPALQYASRYWMRHLGLAEVGEELLAALEDFCNTHLLHWLEVLSLLGCVDGAVEALRSTQLYLKSIGLRKTEATALLYDCERMVQSFYPAIGASFMQVYRTAIPFSPTDSLIRRLHQADVPHQVEVRMGLERDWSTTLASRVTGTTGFSDLSFSLDGTRLVCAVGDRSIELLSTHTAAPLQVFEGHADSQWIRRVSISPAGKEIMSCGDDGTVMLWDVATGACLHTWERRSDIVYSVAWSLDGALVASGENDGTVVLRKIETPEEMVVLRHGPGTVFDVAFAADGNLVSGSIDRTCKIWDTKRIDWDAMDNAPSQTLEHDASVMLVAISPDSCLLACALFDGKIDIWTKADGRRLCSVPRERGVISLAFYSNRRLAVAYKDSPFVLWDITTGTPLDTTHNFYAYHAAFSPDGVLIAHAVHNTLQLRRWSGEAPRESKPKKAMASSPVIRAKRWFKSHLPAICSSPVTESKVDGPSWAIVVSPTGAFVLALYEEEWRLWDVSNGQWIHTVKHAGYDSSTVVWSPPGNLFACTNESDVFVWEARTGRFVGSFAGHSECVTAVVFTADEQHFLSASGDGSIRRWKIHQSPQETCSVVMFQSDGDSITAFSVSSDGQWMLSGSRRRDPPPDTLGADLLAKPSRQPVQYEDLFYCTLRMHDMTGRVVWIEHFTRMITSVTFSEDCTRALVGDFEGAVFLYDLTELIPPEKSASQSPPPLAVPEYQISSGSTRPVYRASFAPDGQGIIAGTRYVPFSSELQHLSIRAARRSPIAVYFCEDEWLWRVDPNLSPRRHCWLPPQFRPGDLDDDRVYSPPTQHLIACKTGGFESRLIVLDVSNC
ncbi:WD40 repeat-like protein [Trametes sanguinea]|nr:WD40 repeat-like protein [Trametes sanguinea]